MNKVNKKIKIKKCVLIGSVSPEACSNYALKRTAKENKKKYATEIAHAEGKLLYGCVSKYVKLYFWHNKLE